MSIKTYFQNILQITEHDSLIYFNV